MTIKELLKLSEAWDERVKIYDNSYIHNVNTVEEALEKLPDDVLNREVSSWRVLESCKLEINHYD